MNKPQRISRGQVTPGKVVRLCCAFFNRISKGAKKGIQCMSLTELLVIYLIQEPMAFYFETQLTLAMKRAVPH